MNSHYVLSPSSIKGDAKTQVVGVVFYRRPLPLISTIVIFFSPLCHHHLVHVCAGVLVQLVAAGEDDEGDLAVAQDGQLVRLLHHPELPLVERNLGLFVSKQLFAILVLPNPITIATILYLSSMPS